MRLLPGARVHEAASKVAGRWAMDHVRVRWLGDQLVLEATDGLAAMVRVPCELTALREREEWPRGGLLIPRAALAELFKGGVKEERHVRVVSPEGAQPELELRRGSTSIRVIASTQEDWAPQADNRFPDYEASHTVSVDSAALLRVIKATGAAAIEIEIPAEGSDENGVIRHPILVRALGKDHRRTGAIGAVAPIVPEG